MSLKNHDKKRSQGPQLPKAKIFTDLDLETKSGCLKALRYYRKYQLLHIRCIKDINSSSIARLTRKNKNIKKVSEAQLSPFIVLKNLFVEDNGIFGDSWTIENTGTSTEHSSISEILAPNTFFSQQIVRSPDDTLTVKSQGKSCSSYYVSCILQKSKRSVENFLDQVPYSSLPLAHPWPDMRMTKPVWIFIGHHVRNQKLNQSTNNISTQVDDLEPMHGRAEHTDSVSHNGTWHYQCSGTKIWIVRPASDAEEWKGRPPVISGKNLHIRCEKNDILAINTRLWWHHTVIPDTMHADFSISMSYARDFYCDASAVGATGNALDKLENMQLNSDSKRRRNESNESSGRRQSARKGSRATPSCMENAEIDAEESNEFTNIDGIYAKTNVKKGQIVFLESELPDAALPRSEEANCEVCETEDGEGCLVALRNISCGDWLSIAPSDSDSDVDD
jgi:hypothetical protein